MKHTFFIFLLFSIPALSLVPGKYFDHLFFIIFENEAYTDVITNSDFMNFANKGCLLTQFFARSHPSQPNYLTILAGDTMGVTDDSNHDINATNLIDLLEAKSVSWKSYNEDYPGNCFTGSSSGKYYRKHTPFISFLDIQTNATRCAKIVDGGQLDVDLLTPQNLSQFMFYTPNQNNDGHDTGLAFAGSFLTSFFNAKMGKFPSNTLFIVTWDEGEGVDSVSNHIYTALVGEMIPNATNDNSVYEMASFTRLIEENWDLGNLGRGDSDAALIFPLKNSNSTSLNNNSSSNTSNSSNNNSSSNIGSSSNGSNSSLNRNSSTTFQFRMDFGKFGTFLFMVLFFFVFS